MIGVLSCVWQRPERLPYTLGQLTQQTAGDWRLFLINNNRELVGYVDDMAAKFDLAATVIHNDRNRGPFARWEVAHQHADYCNHFLTLDDDVNFGTDFLAAWQEQLSDEVRGWSGFRFQGDYWQREQVGPGEWCHYLWGSNLAVPADVVADERIVQLEREFWQADDLWVCYVANHLQGVTLRRADIDINIEVDGKDTYPSQKRTKALFLNALRRRGWQV